MKLSAALIKRYLVITLASLILACGAFFFMYPFSIVLGGVTGISLVLSKFIPLNISVISLIFNVILLIVSLIFIGKEFTLNTVYVSLIIPVFLNILEHLFPAMESITGDPLLDGAALIFINGIGAALLFHLNASSGGMDIPAKIINKYMHIELGSALSVLGLAAALSSIFIASGKIVVLSLLLTYIQGILIDYFIFGMTMKKKVCIISRKHEEILRYILEDMHSGASIYSVTGAYSGKTYPEINVMLTAHEYRIFISWVTKLDPDAFISVYKASEVFFRPKDFGSKASASRYASLPEEK